MEERDGERLLVVSSMVMYSGTQQIVPNVQDRH